MVTLRIEPELLAALKRRAEREGRSVSAEVVRLIRREVEALPRAEPPKPTMGMFPDHEAPDLEVFREARHAASAKLRGSGAPVRRGKRRA